MEEHHMIFPFLLKTDLLNLLPVWKETKNKSSQEGLLKHRIHSWCSWVLLLTWVPIPFMKHHHITSHHITRF